MYSLLLVIIGTRLAAREKGLNESHCILRNKLSAQSKRISSISCVRTGLNMFLSSSVIALNAHAQAGMSSSRNQLNF